METKEIKITPPKGYIIDEANSTFECIKFKKKELTYEDVAKELFYGKSYHYIASDGSIGCISKGCKVNDSDNATSTKQLEKLLAINKLMNVVKYLNGDWKPEFSSLNCSIEYCKHNYVLYLMDDEIRISDVIFYNNGFVYFKTEELAQQAIDILGEDTIRLALSTDW